MVNCFFNLYPIDNRGTIRYNKRRTRGSGSPFVYVTRIRGTFTFNERRTNPFSGEIFEENKGREYIEKKERKKGEFPKRKKERKKRKKLKRSLIVFKLFFFNEQK